MAVGAVFGYYSIQFFMPNQSAAQFGPNRFLASATMSKLGSEQYAKSFFDIKIKNEIVSNSKDEISVVKVTFEAFQKLPPALNYTWHLPEGATLVDGSLTGTLTELEANQTQELEIKLKGYSREFKNHVVFAVKGDLNQSQINQNVIVSSRPEDSFEYIVQENEKLKAKEAQAKNKMGKSGYKPPIDPKNVVF